MVDPDVHFHIIPCYSHNIYFETEKFTVFGWLVLPNFLDINKISKKTFNQLLTVLKREFENNV